MTTQRTEPRESPPGARHTVGGQHDSTATLREHRPGQWPQTPACDQLVPRNRATIARARHWALLSVAEAVLNDQPTPRLVRDAARRICRDVAQLAEDTITANQNPEHQ